MIVPKMMRVSVPPTPIQSEALLLVEGATPAHFFEALALHMTMAKKIEIRDYGGIGDLRTFLNVLASTTDFKARVRRLGITRDAENDVDAAKKSVDGAIHAANLASNVVVKTFIFPDGVQPGMIETLCLRSVTKELLDCVDQFFALAKRGGAILPTGPKLSKHRAQAYLSLRDGPEPVVGIAAYKGIWALDHPAYAPARQFLQDLCI